MSPSKQQPSQTESSTSADDSFTMTPADKSAKNLHHVEAELRLTLEEIARLQNALAEANMKIVALQSSFKSPPNDKDDQQQVLKPLLQELKQPIHTIQGYLDLLSNESVGILGTFQKRFVERISTAVNQMEKSIHNIETETGEVDEENGTYSSEYSLTAVLEETVGLFTELIRTKSITLKVEFEKDEVLLVGDQQKIERVLNILFSNCFTIVAEEGTIALSLKILQGKKPAQVLFSIQSNDHDTPKAKPLPVDLHQFKDHEMKLEGFGSALKDLLKASQWVEEMHGKMEIFSIPSSGSLIRFRIPKTH